MIACIKTKRSETELIVRAFAHGCKGDFISSQDFLKNPDKYRGVAMFGILRGAEECYRLAEKKGIDIYFIDHAYLLANRLYRPRMDKFWFRITKNGHQRTELKEFSGDRWEKFFKNKVQILPWKNGEGSEIVICPPSDTMRKFFGVNGWANDIKKQVSEYADEYKKKIIIREKKSNKATVDWSDIHYLIGYNTAMVYDAIYRGIPAMSTEKTMINTMCGGIEKMKEPVKFDRQPLLNCLAYSQFMVEEMRSGYALEVLDG
jgi:hypothetical protein